MYRDGKDSFGGKNEFQESKHLLSIKISIQLNWQKHLVKKDHRVWEGKELKTWVSRIAAVERRLQISILISRFI